VERGWVSPDGSILDKSTKPRHEGSEEIFASLRIITHAKKEQTEQFIIGVRLP
jgi:hypothetical protein